MSHYYRGRGGKHMTRGPPKHVTDFTWDDHANGMFEICSNLSSMEENDRKIKHFEMLYNGYVKMPMDFLWKDPFYYSNYRLTEECVRILKERKLLLEQSSVQGEDPTPDNADPLQDSAESSTPISETIPDSDPLPMEIITESTECKPPVSDILTSDSASDTESKASGEPAKKRRKKKKKKKKVSSEIESPVVISPTEEKTPDIFPLPEEKTETPVVPDPVELPTKPESDSSQDNSSSEKIESRTAPIKNYKYLFRGLPMDFPTAEISFELGKQDIEITKIVHFKKREGGGAYRPLPLFPVVIPETSNHLAVLDIHQLKDHPIRVEKFRGEKGMIQCFRCQNYGHTQRTCTASNPRCMKCASEHLTYQCTKPLDLPPKCCNCMQQHTSNFSGCPARPKKEKHQHRLPSERSSATPAEQLIDVFKQLKEIIGNNDVRKLLITLLEEASKDVSPPHQ